MPTYTSKRGNVTMKITRAPTKYSGAKRKTVNNKRDVARIFRQMSEKKYLAFNTQTISLLYAGNRFMIPITGSVVEDDSASGERIGNKITPTSFRANYVMTLNNVPANNVSVYRIIVFQWFPDDQQHTPNVIDILQDTAVVGGNDFAAVSQYKQESKGLFRILSDKTKVANKDSNRQVMIKSSVYKNMRPVYYTTSTFPAYGTNQLYMVIIDMHGTLANPSLLAGQAVLRYTDN